MKYILTSIVWIVTILCGAGLFWTSTQVQGAEDRNAALKEMIFEQSERLAVLSAEWHYLNNPAYLEKLTASVLRGEYPLAEVDAPIILAAAQDLPNIEGTLLPVRRPDFTGQEVQIALAKADAASIISESKPVETQVSLAAGAKPRHPVISQTPDSPRQSGTEFGFLLASWTD